MNRLIFIFSVLLIACTNPVSQVEPTKETQHEDHSANKEGSVLRLNNGARWKADEVTRKNVSALVKELNDPGNKGLENKDRLTGQLQSRIDSLVQQCKMEGPEHDALHVWLQQILADLKKMKEVSQAKEYEEQFAILKKDIESFYLFFE